MTRIFSLVLAAILGSLITLGGYQLLDLDRSEIVYMNGNSTNQGVHTNVLNNPPNSRIQATATNFIKTPIITGNLENISTSFTSAAEKTMPGVVHIKSSHSTNMKENDYMDLFDLFNGKDGSGNRPEMNGESLASGSGVIINSDGYIITNNHVIDDASKIEVVLSDNRSYQAEVVGTDPSTDLAVLKIKEEGLPTVDFGDSDALKVGEWVIAVGNPFNLASTVTAGIVSAKGRNINILEDQAPIEAFIQTDAAVNRGNSGGALVNLSGQLIGINSAIATPTGSYAGYSFAIPSNLVMKVFEDLKTYGTVQRGYIGVFIRDMDGNLSKEKNIDITEGVFVSNFVENGAAAEAGIKIGDVIVEVDGLEIKSGGALQEAVGRKHPGDVALVKVYRKGRLIDLSVSLRSKTGGNEILAKANTLGTNQLLRRLGVELKELNIDEKMRYEMNHGVKITQLSKGILSRDTNIREGFVIAKVDSKEVNNLEELITMIEESKGGVLIEGFYPNSPDRPVYYGFGI